MVRNSAPGSALSSWRAYKERAGRAWNEGDWSLALADYRSALTFDSIPPAEKQVILSNGVACRLKIGGTAMATAAIEEAKQSVALNNRWAKGHVRLASAYISLGGHSNDACNALQRALALDPSNVNARQMLMKELRRDRVAREGEDGGGSNDGRPDPGTPSAEEAGGYGPRPPPRGHEDRRHGDGIDESPGLSERFQFYAARASTWWEHDLNDDSRTLIKVLLGLVALYVALGGRFGLDSVLGGRGAGNRGNYGGGNAYDRYYGRSGAGSYDRYDRAGGRGAYDSAYGTRDDHGYYNGRRDRGTSSLHLPDLFDGSWPSIIILCAGGYACHYFGINPFHAIWMLNMMAGNRGRGRGMRNMGMMGMGYGMMNQQMGWGGQRRRHRGGW